MNTHILRSILTFRFQENDKLHQTALMLVLIARNCLSVSELIVDVYLFFFAVRFGGQDEASLPQKPQRQQHRWATECKSSVVTMCCTQSQTYFETEVKTGEESVLFWKLLIVASLSGIKQNATVNQGTSTIDDLFNPAWLSKFQWKSKRG